MPSDCHSWCWPLPSHSVDPTCVAVVDTAVERSEDAAEPVGEMS